MGSLTIPLIPTWYCIGSILFVLVKFKKVKIPYVPFTYIHPTDTHTDTWIHQQVKH